MNTKVPIILNKLESNIKTTGKQQSRDSRKLQTTQHVIRDLYCIRKSYY